MKKAVKIFITLNVLIVLSCQNNTADSKDNAVKETYFMSEQELDARILESPPLLSPTNYVQWVEDPKNGLKKQKEIKDIIFNLLYQPAEYIICQDRKKQSITTDELNKELDAHSDLEYYNLKIAAKDASGELLKYNLNRGSDYQQRVDYYAFQFEKDIKLIVGTDTIPCSIFHFERTYDVAPYSSFLFAFKIPAKSKGKDRTIVIDDKIFNKGTVKFLFSEKRIKTLPKLEVEEMKHLQN